MTGRAWRVIAAAAIGCCLASESRWPGFAVAQDGGSAPTSGVGVPSVVARSACRVHSELVPRSVHLGERAMYRGWAVVPRDVAVRWIPPRSAGAFTWGRAEARRVPALASAGAGGRAPFDTVQVEIPLQVFQLGRASIAGIQMWLPWLPPDPRASIRRLPTLEIMVVPVLTSGDSASDLRPPRGPLAAPWWERVPWRRLALIALALVAVAALILWLRRRRPGPVAAIPRVRRDPAAEALAELAALRRLDLPAQERFAEHALHLTRIVRRFLESTAGLTRPGDSTPELVDHLRAARLGADDLIDIEQLLRGWDRVKFARADSSPEDARHAERRAEALIRRPAPSTEMGQVA